MDLTIRCPLRCRRCDITKPFDQFPYAKHNRPLPRRRIICCDCTSELSAEKLRLMPPDQREDYRAKRRADYHANKERRRAVHAAWLSKPENKEKVKARTKEYKTEKREWINQRRRQRRIVDPVKRVSDNCRNRVRKALERGTKSAHTEALMGCTYEEYTVYLESRWTKGMSWDNYGYGHGKWVIDHIEPICSFNVLDPIEQRKAFNYTNTQPMWHSDHLLKLKEDKRKCLQHKPNATTTS